MAGSGDRVKSRQPKRLDFDDNPSEATTTSFTINRSFAEKYEERKKKEELSQLKEKYGEDARMSDSDEDDDSDDEPEDEHGELVTPQVDAEIMKTISLIRSRDPAIYDPKTTFFTPTQMTEAQAAWAKKKQDHASTDKPMTLQDYHRRELLTGGEAQQSSPPVITHQMQQESLKSDLKKALNDVADQVSPANDDDDDGNLFTIRSKSKDEITEEEDAYAKFLLQHIASTGKESTIQDWRSFAGSENTDPKEAFLMEYILTKGWVDKTAEKVPSYDEIVGADHDDSDDLAVDAAEEFERQHNFRYEEEGADQIVSYARDVEDSMRRKDDRRKESRSSRKERKATEKLKKEEELKRLKNLKKEELHAKLKKIHEIAGGELPGFEDVDLEKDFDPEEFDSKMEGAFGDDYYQHADDAEKPDFGGDIDVSDLVGSNDGDDNAAPLGELDAEGEEEYWEGEEEEYDETYADEDAPYHVADDNDFIMDADYIPRPKKSKASVSPVNAEGKKKSLSEYLEEVYSLDYEDLIGDLPTRFKYQKVAPQAFSLTPEDILVAGDQELNQLVSIKKLAPFRRPDLVAKDEEKWKKNKKKRLREFRKILEERNAAKAAQQSEGSKSLSDKKLTKKQKRDKDHKHRDSKKHKSSSSTSETGISAQRLSTYTT